jgi:hypothetical protein
MRRKSTTCLILQRRERKKNSTRRDDYNSQRTNLPTFLPLKTAWMDVAKWCSCSSSSRTRRLRSSSPRVCWDLKNHEQEKKKKKEKRTKSNLSVSGANKTTFGREEYVEG